MHTTETRRHAVNSRATLVAAAAAILAAVIFGYAGGSWAVVLYRLLTDGALAMLWVLAATGAGAFLLRSLRLSAVSPALRGATAAGLGLGAFSLIVLGLGLAGVLSGATAWLLVLIGLLLSAWELRRGAWVESIQTWLWEPVGWEWMVLIGVPFLAIAIVGALVPPGILWGADDPAGYDVVEYHLQAPREWFEAGRVVPLRHNAFSYMPFNVEMHYLLAMHLRGGPWAGMYLAQFMHVAMVVLSVIAIYGAARSQTRQYADGRFAALLATLVAAATPWMSMLAAVAYNEGGLLLFGTLAIAWAFGPSLAPPAFPLARDSSYPRAQYSSYPLARYSGRGKG